MKTGAPVSQLSLHLRDPRWRPVADVDGVKWALNIESEEVDGLVDLGHLIGFNIAIDVNGRRELRFLTRSIEHYRATLGSRPLVLDQPQIYRLLISHTKPVIDGTEIDVALNCDPDHRQNLIRADLLAVVSSPNLRDWRPGPGGSPIVTRASFEQFLKRRML